NSYCSGDTLVRGPMDLQWFGRPGPGPMIDRHRATVAPLSRDGRVFIPGDECLFGVDAYNGTMLWEAKLPRSRRLRMAFDSSSMVLDERFVHWLAQDKCNRLDVATGAAAPPLTMPQLIADQPHHWGWLAVQGDVLLGSAMLPGSSYSDPPQSTQPAAEPPAAAARRAAVRDRRIRLVISDYLFAMDRRSGKVIWSHHSGQIINPTLAAGGGRVYFIECHSPKTSTQPSGRAPVDDLFAASTFLVALDLQTGQPIFRLPVDDRVAKIRETAYINYANGVVLLSGGAADKETYHYYYHAFDAATGKLLWQADHDSGLKVSWGHGAPNRWPVVMGDRVQAWPYEYDLKTGRRTDNYKFDRLGHGCGTVSAAAGAIFWRGSIPMMHDRTTQAKPAPLTTETRPGCWVNIIPAGGLVLIPEASSGCTCPYSLQTSLALIPREQAAAPTHK
ncbi:MAG: PQQ-binding-like beta-propeller repeat protein, partial [Planctomycetaceae bacterium]|nr:PQQ-binding-like beta-propeller repeat protein [Planctomycetaceae bacterium]